MYCNRDKFSLFSDIILYTERIYMTPTIIDNHVEKLIKLLNTNTPPIYLNVTPEPYSQVTQCFTSVDEKIKRDGGSQVLGWQIWKSDILVEAEFHAVWKSPNGDLQDITPKQIDISKILFLPDPKAQYVGSQVDNIRVNITQNKLIDDFIEISKAIFKMENKGNRAFEYELKLIGAEAQNYKVLTQIKHALYSMITHGYNRNSTCFCHSGKKYKHCHGHKFTKTLKSI